MESKPISIQSTPQSFTQDLILQNINELFWYEIPAVMLDQERKPGKDPHFEAFRRQFPPGCIFN